MISSLETDDFRFFSFAVVLAGMHVKELVAVYFSMSAMMGTIILRAMPSVA